MMRSLYSGVSGLRSHQTRMDVIGANISNVNTVGFKASRVTFRDVVYQSLTGATRPIDEVRGGVNPYQIGLGTQVASIDLLMTRAGPALTDRPLDAYIDGEGFFRVRGPGSEDLAQEYFTRVGNFSFDELGQLVDSNGNFVLGVNSEMVPLMDYESVLVADSLDGPVPEYDAVPIAIGEDNLEVYMRLTNISLGPDGIITAYDPLGEPGEEIVVIGEIALYKFANNYGLVQVGNTYYQQSANSGEPYMTAPGLNGTGSTISNRLEMSNVELAKEFTDMIVTQRGFQANSRIITVSDEMLQELVNLKR